MKAFWQKYREIAFLIFVCFCVFVFNILYEYQKFLDFKENKHIFLQDVKVLQSYTKTSKKGRVYRVLKLSTKDYDFYTTMKLENNFTRHQSLNLGVITTQVSFLGYLSKSFYMPSYKAQINKEISYKHSIIPYFLHQHSSEKIKEFYGALFFALPVSLELRTDVNYYGIAHLIAISGYHIALLFSLIFFLVAPFYSFFQKRYFPYRNLKLDLSVMIFILLFGYAWLIGFVPSYVRSLIMALWGFFIVSKNIKIISFLNLFLSILICLALFPQLLFSVGFFFSVLGVFYIFLYMHHFSKYFNNFINVILLNFWTFFAMVLPVLYFFPLISLQQILAIPLSVLFVLFYPLNLLLHFVGFGGLFDEYLIHFFEWKIYGTDFKLGFYPFIIYVTLSLLSIKSRYLAMFCILANLVPFWILL